MEHIRYNPSHSLLGSINQLTSVLSAHSERGVQRRMKRGRIDARNVHRALRGQRDFKKVTWHQPGFTTAVGVLVDMSGSMAHYNLCPIAQAATRALLMGIEQCGNPVACWGFVDHPHYLFGNKYLADKHKVGVSRRDDGKTARGLCNRMTYKTKGVNCDVDDASFKVYSTDPAYVGCLIELKSFANSVAGSDKRLSLINHVNTRSGTPCASAMTGGADLLAAVPADRRILMVVTDGEDNLGSNYVRVATQYCNALGVETVGVALANNRYVVPDHIRPGDYDAYSIAMCEGREHTKADVDNPLCRVEQADALGSSYFQTLAQQLGKGRTSKARIEI
jgi:hypothetical protein